MSDDTDYISSLPPSSGSHPAHPDAYSTYRPSIHPNSKPRTSPRVTRKRARENPPVKSIYPPSLPYFPPIKNKSGTGPEKRRKMQAVDDQAGYGSGTRLRLTGTGKGKQKGGSKKHPQLRGGIGDQALPDYHYRVDPQCGMGLPDISSPRPKPFIPPLFSNIQYHFPSLSPSIRSPSHQSHPGTAFSHPHIDPQDNQIHTYPNNAWPTQIISDIDFSPAKNGTIAGGNVKPEVLDIDWGRMAEEWVWGSKRRRVQRGGEGGVKRGLGVDVRPDLGQLERDVGRADYEDRDGKKISNGFSMLTANNTSSRQQHSAPVSSHFHQLHVAINPAHPRNITRSDTYTSILTETSSTSPSGAGSKTDIDREGEGGGSLGLVDIMDVSLCSGDAFALESGRTSMASVQSKDWVPYMQKTSSSGSVIATANSGGQLASPRLSSLVSAVALGMEQAAHGHDQKSTRMLKAQDSRWKKQLKRDVAKKWDGIIVGNVLRGTYKVEQQPAQSHAALPAGRANTVSARDVGHGALAPKPDQESVTVRSKMPNATNAVKRKPSALQNSVHTDIHDEVGAGPSSGNQADMDSDTHGLVDYPSSPIESPKLDTAGTQRSPELRFQDFPDFPLSQEADMDEPDIDMPGQESVTSAGCASHPFVDSDDPALSLAEMLEQDEWRKQSDEFPVLEAACLGHPDLETAALRDKGSTSQKQKSIPPTQGGRLQASMAPWDDGEFEVTLRDRQDDEESELTPLPEDHMACNE